MRLKCCAIIVKLCKERERDAVRKVVGCDSPGNGWFNDGDTLYLGYIFHARNVIIKILIQFNRYLNIRLLYIYMVFEYLNRIIFPFIEFTLHLSREIIRASSQCGFKRCLSNSYKFCTNIIDSFVLFLP